MMRSEPRRDAARRRNVVIAALAALGGALVIVLLATGGLDSFGPAARDPWMIGVVVVLITGVVIIRVRPSRGGDPMDNACCPPPEKSTSGH
ncbi:hypothetical protein [Actinokineospora sp. HUAS TT18]|uniref:hypothetical protein n=1 Tax=Actinokineospora sp. HUAS TT18 TaxID=3447451 RepID=UPI003F52745F